MRVRDPGRRAARLLVAGALALSFLPFGAGSADARRIKVRSGSHTSSGTDRTDTSHSYYGVRIGSRSAAGSNEKDQPSRRMPGAAEAAAERARAALAAESALKPAATLAPSPVSADETKSDRAVCVAGC